MEAEPFEAGPNRGAGDAQSPVSSSTATAASTVSCTPDTTTSTPSPPLATRVVQPPVDIPISADNALDTEADAPPPQPASAPRFDAAAAEAAPLAPPAPFNPAAPDDLFDDMARIRGDAIGDTLYSSRFVLQTLLKLQEYVTVLSDDGLPASISDNESFERDLCLLWDMTTEADVVRLLLEKDVLELFATMIVGSMDQRLCEVLLGIIANMCSVEAARQALSDSNFVFPALLSLISCSDPLVLLQLMRLITAAISFDNNGEEEVWFRHFRDVPRFVEQFATLLNNSLHSAMLINAYEAMAFICNKFAVMDIQSADGAADDDDEDDDGELLPAPVERLAGAGGVPTFRELFIKDCLVAASFVAFRQLLPPNAEASDDASAPTKRTRKIVNIFLDIQIVLTQFEADSRRVYEAHLDSLHECLAQVLEPLGNAVYLFPINFNDIGIIENVNEIAQSLGDPFSTACYAQMLHIWSLIHTNRKQHNSGQPRRGEHDAANGWRSPNSESNVVVAGAAADGTDENDELNVDDALLTILEYLSRATKAASTEELTECLRSLEVRPVQTVYTTLRYGDTDPDIEESCAKLHRVALDCWSIDLDTVVPVDEAEAEAQRIGQDSGMAEAEVAEQSTSTTTT